MDKIKLIAETAWHHAGDYPFMKTLVGDILNLKGIKNFKNVGQKKLIKLIKLSFSI